MILNFLFKLIFNINNISNISKKKMNKKKKSQSFFPG